MPATAPLLRGGRLQGGVKPPPCAAACLSLSHCISLSLSVQILQEQTLAEGVHRRLPLCDARRSPSLAPSSPPCRAARSGERNRPGIACVARAALFFLTAGRRSPSPLPVLWCAPVLSIVSIVPRVRMRSSPPLFPSLALPETDALRRCSSAAARLVAGAAPMSSWMRRHQFVVARALVFACACSFLLGVIGNGRLRARRRNPLRR